MEGVAAFLTALITLILWIVKRRQETAPPREEERFDETVDRDLADNDLSDLAQRLSRLHDAARRRRAAGGPPPPPGL